MRVGIGYDVHSFVEGRPLILGGVKVPYHLGLKGHSDADVLVHAVMDALLGAAGCGDIGKHFPDTDPQYRGISSLVLLKDVIAHLNNLQWVVGNVDAVVIAQAPKIAPYIEQMRVNMAREMGVATNLVSVKATTTEGLGFAGRGEGISAQAVACIYPATNPR
ncbi:2-C-methyl-D-erythritol 2,4-cyclodiphosphate synthase [Desulfoscipio gibsoniae]|uniref:2-C-methyl-D-erythritol 2,4-cyclodiphosphate synthase n=1 Tax=Desulfoscipio gibsoniae DSM 7213 TaxID=767817 RepID=R4K9S7_9FIRM|nr:2-C-methyl-D-erythritol 2,4-cyclodiphosphate synthase [Desulfoscipio gibsoniae]AGK99917.1 2-C-methyl-D-erythritol 2,4-cyclodiphosphate synthase [Desulfoscipio gibsoniae DSM 7213]